MLCTLWANRIHEASTHVTASMKSFVLYNVRRSLTDVRCFCSCFTCLCRRCVAHLVTNVRRYGDGIHAYGSGRRAIASINHFDVMLCSRWVIVGVNVVQIADKVCTTVHSSVWFRCTKCVHIMFLFYTNFVHVQNRYGKTTNYVRFANRVCRCMHLVQTT